jgi:alpha-amylase
MKELRLSRAVRLLPVLFVLAIAGLRLGAQSGFDDNRVLLQGFYWESYRHGHSEKFPTAGADSWYNIVRQRVPDIRSAGFDLVWLPPPFYAGAYSAGYNPKEYFTFTNSYGTFDEHRAMLTALLQAGVEPVADLVFNHRDGSMKWADFMNPAWDTRSICKYDECFLRRESEVFGTPDNMRGADEPRPVYLPTGATTYAYDSFRDLDHSNKVVRLDLIRAMRSLRSLGYRGWRYDMVHGFDSQWIAVYNRATAPTFSVGEYDWDKHSQQRGWIWFTATDPSKGGADHLRTSSSVFDFTSQFTLKDNKGNPRALSGFGFGTGMVGDTTDGLPWKQRAVTFTENHDTGYRTNEDGTPQDGHQFDSFQNNWEIQQAYAYILTHPGVPCVYWKHYFDWGADLQAKLKATINARKVAGVHSGSEVNIQQNAWQSNVYAARVVGSKGMLYVRIGGSDETWNPSMSNYKDYREYAAGDGWKVWVAIAGNPPVQQAKPLFDKFPVPEYTEAVKIEVKDSEIDL